MAYTRNPNAWGQGPEFGVSTSMSDTAALVPHALHERMVRKHAERKEKIRNMRAGEELAQKRRGRKGGKNKAKNACSKPPDPWHVAAWERASACRFRDPEQLAIHVFKNIDKVFAAAFPRKDNYPRRWRDKTPGKPQIKRVIQRGLATGKIPPLLQNKKLSSR